MLTEETPDTIKATLQVKAQGAEYTLALTYHNRDQDEFDAFARNADNLKPPSKPEPTGNAAVDDTTATIETFRAANIHLVLYLVKSFDDGSDVAFPLNYAGMEKLDKRFPGLLSGIIRGYHQARAAEVQKN